jgi:hypothetical protein
MPSRPVDVGLPPVGSQNARLATFISNRPGLVTGVVLNVDTWTVTWNDDDGGPGGPGGGPVMMARATPKPAKPTPKKPKKPKKGAKPKKPA